MGYKRDLGRGDSDVSGYVSQCGCSGGSQGLELVRGKVSFWPYLGLQPTDRPGAGRGDNRL